MAYVDVGREVGLREQAYWDKPEEAAKKAGVTKDLLLALAANKSLNEKQAGQRNTAMGQQIPAGSLVQRNNQMLQQPDPRMTAQNAGGAAQQQARQMQQAMQQQAKKGIAGAAPPSVAAIAPRGGVADAFRPSLPRTYAEGGAVSPPTPDLMPQQPTAPSAGLSPDAAVFLDEYMKFQRSLEQAQSPQEKAQVEQNFQRGTQNISSDAKAEAFQYMDAQKGISSMNLGMKGGGMVKYANGGPVLQGSTSALSMMPTAPTPYTPAPYSPAPKPISYEPYKPQPITGTSQTFGTPYGDDQQRFTIGTPEADAEIARLNAAGYDTGGTLIDDIVPPLYAGGTLIDDIVPGGYVDGSPEAAWGTAGPYLMPPGSYDTPADPFSQPQCYSGGGIVALQNGGGPLNVRGNNPGNLRYNPANDWLGSTGPDDRGFETFESLPYGTRALAQTVNTYGGKHGLKTIREIISRFSPPNENDTERLIQEASRRMGVSPDQPLDMDAQETVARLASAIARQEHSVDISPERVQEMVSQIEGGNQPSSNDAARNILNAQRAAQQRDNILAQNAAREAPLPQVPEFIDNQQYAGEIGPPAPEQVEAAGIAATMPRAGGKRSRPGNDRRLDLLGQMQSQPEPAAQRPMQPMMPESGTAPAPRNLSEPQIGQTMGGPPAGGGNNWRDITIGGRKLFGPAIPAAVDYLSERATLRKEGSARVQELVDEGMSYDEAMRTVASERPRGATPAQAGTAEMADAYLNKMGPAQQQPANNPLDALFQQMASAKSAREANQPSLAQGIANRSMQQLDDPSFASRMNRFFTGAGEGAGHAFSGEAAGKAGSGAYRLAQEDKARLDDITNQQLNRESQERIYAGRDQASVEAAWYRNQSDIAKARQLDPEVIERAAEEYDEMHMEQDRKAVADRLIKESGSGNVGDPEFDDKVNQELRRKRDAFVGERARAVLQGIGTATGMASPQVAAAKQVLSRSQGAR